MENYELQSERLRRLCEEARERWPGLTLDESLSNLYRAILRKLITARMGWPETKELAIDLQLVVGERMRLKAAMIEEDSVRYRESQTVEHAAVPKA